MKIKRIIATAVATILTISAMGISALAENDDNTVLYSYDDNGTTVNITQADFDAAHWDKDALGDTLPMIYEEFPMSMTGYSNDFSELYLDFEYMKKLSEMDSVHLTITDVLGRKTIFDKDLSNPSFYSPQIEIGKIYDVTLTETVDGIERSYHQEIIAQESDADMPEYVTNADDDDENIIMICDIDLLKVGKVETADNSFELNTDTVEYEHIKASDFDSYCQALPTGKIYRLYTIADGQIYSGYLSTDNGIKIYDLSIEVNKLEEMGSLGETSSISSVPTYTTADIEANAEIIRYGEYSYKLTENSNARKYAAVSVAMPDSFSDGSANPPTFRVTVRAQSQVVMKLWRSIDEGSLISTASRTSSNNSNTITYNLSPIYTANDYVNFYIMVYLTDAVTGYVSIDVEPISGSYTDDVTGSAYDAYNGASVYDEMENSEFTMTDSWDIDRFYLDYPGTKNCTYKIELRNRSLEEQTALETGDFTKIIKGSRAKYLVLGSVTDKGTVVDIGEYAIYEVPKGADLAVYNQISRTGADLVTIYEQKFSVTGGEKYQLSFTKYIAN